MCVSRLCHLTRMVLRPAPKPRMRALAQSDNPPLQLQLALAIEELLQEGCPLIVVRAKDRLNNPLSSGYTDFLLNVRLANGPHSSHVGELQVCSLHTNL